MMMQQCTGVPSIIDRKWESLCELVVDEKHKKNIKKISADSVFGDHASESSIDHKISAMCNRVNDIGRT